MAERVWNRTGGILGLRQLLREYGEAIEYDVLCVGRDIDDLGSRRLSWRHLWVIVRQSPASSALNRAASGMANGLSVTDAVLADIANTGRLSLWQRGGSKGRKPDLIDVVSSAKLRPFGEGVSVDEMDRRLGWRRTSRGFERAGE